MEKEAGVKSGIGSEPGAGTRSALITCEELGPASAEFRFPSPDTP